MTPEELKSFLESKIYENPDMAEEFLLDEAAYDFFKDYEDDELMEIGLPPLDQMTNKDLVDYFLANDMDITDHLELFDDYKVSEYLGEDE